MRTHLAWCAGVLLAGSSLLAQSDLPSWTLADWLVGGGGPQCIVQLPTADAATQWLPLALLLLPPGQDADAAAVAAAPVLQALAERGFAAVAVSGDSDSLRPLPGMLRQSFLIAQGGLHLVGIGAGNQAATALAAAVAHEFRTVTWCGDGGWPVPRELSRLPFRPLYAFADGEAPTGLQRRPALAAEELPKALAEHLAGLQGDAASTGAAAAVAAALDDFHDAAAKGDAARYFARLPADAVFLGTDAAERWNGAEFRQFATPYFRGRPAWIYVPVQRRIELLSEAVAMFDELLDNESYGLCRGSGVLERRADLWVVRQYNLSIQVPNSLTRQLVARIRAEAAGQPLPSTTVVLVRHAEKQEGDDPELTPAGQQRAERLVQVLSELPLQAAFATQFRRTQATLQPLCAARGLPLRVVQAGAATALVQQLRAMQGGAAVVAAHTNTIPGLLRAMGVAAEVEIEDEDYGNLLLVTLGVDGASLLRLRF